MNVYRIHRCRGYGLKTNGRNNLVLGTGRPSTLPLLSPVRGPKQRARSRPQRTAMPDHVAAETSVPRHDFRRGYRRVARHGTSSQHTLTTALMGPKDGDVVEFQSERLRAGVEHTVDASIFPHLTASTTTLRAWQAPEPQPSRSAPRTDPLLSPHFHSRSRQARPSNDGHTCRVQMRLSCPSAWDPAPR